jgi:List-Bact-rpt repeat protein/PKD domain-containing protein
VRLGGRRVRAAAAGLAVLTAGAGLALAGATGGYPATRPQLLSGAAWLASSQVGQLSLLDGSSAEVAAQVQVAAHGDQLDVVQQAATAYAVNGTGGTIRRVDGATFEVGPPASPLPQAGTGLQAFAGPDALYALDSARGVLASADPKTLLAKGPTVPLAAQISPRAAALDDAGRLWVLDTATGDLVWVEHGTRHTRRNVAHPGGLLVLADGVPVVVDPATRSALVLDPQTAATRTAFGLDLRAGDHVEISGSPHNPRLYLVARPGLVDICDLGANGCTTAVPLGDGELGAPVETADRLFVPDYATGQVWIVDLRDKRVIAQPKVLDPKTRFQLLTRDGVVFFNDPASEHAGVIRLDGGVRPVAKYDPRNPEKGLTDQPGDQPSPVPSPDSSNPPPSAPPPTPEDSGSPPQDTPGVRIAASKTTAQVGEGVTLKVLATGRAAPTAARWTFGDGQSATGIVVGHSWASAQTFQVSVRVTFADGRKATASVSIRVTSRRPTLSVTVSSGGTVTGAGLSCPPTCQTSTAPGQLVKLTATPSPAAGFVLTGWGGACSGTAATCTVTMNGNQNVSATFGPPTSVVLPAPVLVSPANGAVLFNYPRTTTVTWRSVNGAARYHLEAQINKGTWMPAADTMVTSTSASFGFDSDNPGRWRVTAIAPDGSPGTTSAWRTFSYDTRIAAFAGTWVNADPTADTIAKVSLAPTSATSGTLHVWASCGGGTTTCDWGTTTATLSGTQLHAFYDQGFATRTINISRSGPQLVVQIHSHFTDNSGRPDYDITAVMNHT